MNVLTTCIANLHWVVIGFALGVAFAVYFNGRPHKVSYNDLSQSSLANDERKAEAIRICELLKPHVHLMNHSEAAFVGRVSWPHYDVTVKQLFWLRDIKAKYEELL